MAENPYVNKVDLADGTVLIDISTDTVTAGKMLSGTVAHDKSGAEITGTIPSKSGSDITVSGDTVSVPAGYYASAESKAVDTGNYSASVSSHSVTTTPVVSGALSGTGTDIGTTTKPSGTDGTDYWTFTPGGSVTITGVSTAKGVATIVGAGYIGTGSTQSSASTVNITPTILEAPPRYLPKATASISGSNTVTPSVSVSNGNCTLSNTDNGIYVTATGGGTASASAAATTNQTGYAPASAQLGTGTIAASSNTTAVTKYITAITVPKDQGFSVTTTADTALETTSDLVITNNAHRRVNITNKGTTLITNSSVTKFTSDPLVSNSLTVTANAPDGTLESDKVIISSGAWVTTTVTDEGTYYGRVIVPNICLVISVSATSSTSKTISDSKITSGHYVFNTASTLPTADLSWSTSSGSLTLSCSGGIPAMTVFLCRQI